MVEIREIGSEDHYVKIFESKKLQDVLAEAEKRGWTTTTISQIAHCGSNAAIDLVPRHLPAFLHEQVENLYGKICGEEIEFMNALSTTNTENVMYVLYEPLIKVKEAYRFPLAETCSLEKSLN